jgi:hypothetical protein
VGTGDAFSRRYGQTNALVEAGPIRLMIDFGSLAPMRLEEMGRSLAEITHVVVSHIHADHIGGLEELAFLSHFVHNRKVVLLTPPDLRHLLWEHSLRGGLEMVADENGEPVHCELETFFHLHEMQEGWQQVGPISIHPFKTDHVPGKDSWGFIVRDEESGHQMIFGCDTRVCHPELMQEPISEDFASGPIFHDCRLSGGGASTIHVPLSDIRYPQAVQERIVLVHYGDNLKHHMDAIREAGLKVARPDEIIKLPDWESCLSLR